MSTRIELEHKFLIKNNFKIYELDKIVEMASEILGPQDPFLQRGYLVGNLLDVLVPLSNLDNCERALAVPELTKDMLTRYYERPNGTECEKLAYIFGDFRALAVCFPKYWARDGVPQKLKENLARLVLMHQMVVGNVTEPAAAEAGAAEPAPAGFTRQKAKPFKKTGGSARPKMTARMNTGDRPAAKD
jgi:hypothetical protein